MRSARVIDAAVKRVVFATIDPNPVVAGRGVELLEAAGVEVLHLIDFEKSARAINPGYFKRRENGLPFVRCKLAMSLDGRTALANGVSKWITSATARADGQFLRARSSAIVTGVTTVLRDNPSLNLRSDELDISSSQRERNAIGFSRQPLRVILDSKLRTPASARILQQAGAVKIYTTVAAASVAIGRNPAVNVEIRTVASDGQRVNLRTVLESLASDFECNEILVEAGSTLSTAFIKAGMVDELIIYIAPKFLGSDAQSLLEFSGLKSMTESLNFEIIDLSKVGGDIRVTLVPQNSTGE